MFFYGYQRRMTNFDFLSSVDTSQSLTGVLFFSSIISRRESIRGTIRTPFGVE
jgi:hypothetical protein